MHSDTYSLRIGVQGSINALNGGIHSRFNIYMSTTSTHTDIDGRSLVNIPLSTTKAI